MRTDTHVDEFASQGQSPGRRQTIEQRTATEALRVQARAYSVTLDVEGWPLILGGKGQVEYHDGRDLAVYFEAPRPGHLVERLIRAGARRHQTGDHEARLLFAPEALPAIATLVKAHRRRPGRSAEGLALARERSPIGRRKAA